MLTRDGIKPQSNKVQAILMIQPPKGVNHFQHFLGMMPYSHNLWLRWSVMLAPLTSLVEECSQTKVTKAKGTKKVPWHWDKIHQRAFNHKKAWCKLLIKVPYKHTFGAPDQGQMLDVWESQTSESALRWQMRHVMPHHNLELLLKLFLNMCLG